MISPAFKRPDESDMAHIELDTDELPIVGTTFPRRLLWVGDDQHWVRIDYGILRRDLGYEKEPKVGDEIYIRPYKLKVIEENFAWHFVVCYRGKTRLLAYWYAALCRATQWVYFRLLLTAYVWGLARCHHGEIPTWRNLKPFCDWKPK